MHLQRCTTKLRRPRWKFDSVCLIRSVSILLFPFILLPILFYLINLFSGSLFKFLNKCFTINLAYVCFYIFCLPSFLFLSNFQLRGISIFSLILQHICIHTSMQFTMLMPMTWIWCKFGCIETLPIQNTICWVKDSDLNAMEFVEFYAFISESFGCEFVLVTVLCLWWCFCRIWDVQYPERARLSGWVCIPKARCIKDWVMSRLHERRSVLENLFCVVTFSPE